MSIKSLAASDVPFMGGKIHASPLTGHSISFQIVDEFDNGQSYAGLTYEITDYEDIVYTGKEQEHPAKLHCPAAFSGFSRGGSLLQMNCAALESPSLASRIVTPQLPQ